MDEYLYAEYDVLPVPFVQGLAVGFILTMLLVGICYGIPAAWWWLQDRRAADFDEHADQAIANTVEREARS